VQTANHSVLNESSKRYALITLILLLCVAAGYYLSLRLISQIHLVKAQNHMQAGHYGLVSASLQKAYKYQPKEYRIPKQLGAATRKSGALNNTARSAYFQAQKARNYFLEAFRLNPLDVETAYNLAVVEQRLKHLYPLLHTNAEDNPHNPLPFYQQAIRLRPNGIRIHYALARYLYQEGRQDELLKVIHTLTRIFPGTYYHLKQEKFWSASVKAACKLGLQEAIQENIAAATAHRIFSNIMAGEQDWDAAIRHYQAAIQMQPLNKTQSMYFHLGRLYLHNRHLKAAQTSFLKGLALSHNRDKQLESLYHVFKNAGYTEEFYDFYKEVNQRFSLSARTGILLARTLMDLKQYNQARRILEDLNAQELSATVCYWLARIAQLEKDWDKMELAIQKATVLEPDNIQYRRLFLSVLKRLKKIESAQRELELIIQYSDKPSANLFSEKAQIKWLRKDYSGAVKDWQAAIRLQPGSAGFYARTAEAWIMLGKWSLAVEYYQKAVKLDPDNQKYQKRLLELNSEGA